MSRPILRGLERLGVLMLPVMPQVSDLHRRDVDHVGCDGSTVLFRVCGEDFDEPVVRRWTACCVELQDSDPQGARPCHRWNDTEGVSRDAAFLNQGGRESRAEWSSRTGAAIVRGLATAAPWRAR